MATTKACNTCGVFKPETAFPTHGRKPDGSQRRKAHCKACELVKRKAWAKGESAPASMTVLAEPTKECRTCKQVLPRSSFHSNGNSRKRGTPPLKADCKACYSAARTGIAAPLDMRRLAAAVQMMHEEQPQADQHANDLQAALAAVSMAVSVLTQVLIRRGLA